MPKDRRFPERHEQSPEMRAVLELMHRELVADVARFAAAMTPDEAGPWAAALPYSRGRSSSPSRSFDRRVVIPLVLAVVFAVLVLLLRALVAPVLLIATVVLSYFAALGVGWFTFEHLFGFQAMDIQVMLIGFLFLVALGVDYNIFLVSRIRQEVALHGHREGVLRGLAVTGGVITSAGVVLAATFAVLLLAPLVAFVEIGFIVAVSVLIDTLLVRSVLVPALALDIGRRFWWPSRPERPISTSVPVDHDRVDLAVRSYHKPV